VFGSDMKRRMAASQSCQKLLGKSPT